MNVVVNKGVNERQYGFSLSAGLVTALVHVQGSARLVEVVLRQIERLLEHTSEERRQRVERELLDAAIEPERPPPSYKPTLTPLRLELQERVLQVVLDARTGVRGSGV